MGGVSSCDRSVICSTPRQADENDLLDNGYGEVAYLNGEYGFQSGRISGLYPRVLNGPSQTSSRVAISSAVRIVLYEPIFLLESLFPHNSDSHALLFFRSSA